MLIKHLNLLVKNFTQTKNTKYEKSIAAQIKAAE